MALATRHSQRVSLQAQAAGHRGAAESTRRGSGGALPETPGQKYRLIYLSANRIPSLTSSFPRDAPPASLLVVLPYSVRRCISSPIGLDNGRSHEKIHIPSDLAASMAVRVLSEARPTPFIPPAPVIRATVPSSPPSLPSPLPALLGRCTAINNEFTAGDKRRLLGGEIQHAIGDIGGRAGSAEGDTP